MKEFIKGILLLTGLVLFIYAIMCLGEFLSKVITIQVLSKIICIAGVIAVIILIKERKK